MFRSENSRQHPIAGSWSSTDPATPGIVGESESRIDFEVLENIFISWPQNPAASPSLASPSLATTTNTIATNAQRTILYSAASNTTLKATSFSELNLRRRKLPDIFTNDRSKPWWLDVQNPSEEEVRTLCQAFKVHPLTVEDILNRESTEKFDEFNTYYFTCLGSYRLSETQTELSKDPDDLYQPYSVYIIVFPIGALSFSFGHNNHGNNIMHRLELMAGSYDVTSDWFLYAFADDVVDFFAPSITKLERIVNTIEDQVYTNRKSDMQQFVYKITLAEKAVSWLRKLLQGKPGVLSSFEKHRCKHERLYDNEGEGEGDGDGDGGDGDDDQTQDPNHNLRIYINDVQDHVISMMSSLQQFESLLARSEANYLAGAKIDYLAGRERVNQFLGVITIFTTIVTLDNVVAQLFSMNTSANVALFVKPSHAWYYIVGGQAFLTIFLMLMGKKLQWY